MSRTLDRSVWYCQAMPAATTRPSARERLLDAADELFYAEGVHSVGIDRVIERAGVAKASLYSTFGSKDELIRAYLERKDLARRARVERLLETRDDPRERLLALLDDLAAQIAGPAYHGCAFINASAESPAGGCVDQACSAMRAWRRGLLTTLAREAGAHDPARLAGQLVLLHDGAVVAAEMDGDREAAASARVAAIALIDAAC
jgi:AcrR family transcriptional regulator